jgi:hypothetical protein
MSSIRALRVGVLLADTLVSEHVVHSGTAFTIGQSIRNLVPLPVAGLPRRWQLVELVERGVLLRLGPGMGARVAVDGHVLGRADLDARGAHTRTATLVTLPPGTHGKIDLGGEVRILFQELRMPAPAPRPQLPRAVKGTLRDRIDRRMAVFAAASMLVHLGIMTAAHLNDPPEDSTAAQRALAQYTPETISIIDADDPILDLEPAPEPGAAATPAPSKPEPSQPSPSRPAVPARPRPAQPVHSDAGDLAEDATRMADLLFAGSGGGKVDAGDMAPRKPGNDLEKQLQEMADKNAKATIGNEDGDRLRDRPGARPGTSTEPALPGDPSIASADGDKGEKVPPPTRIDVKPQPPRQPGVDTEAIVAKIRTTYMGAMQRCYKKALGDEPSLSGKVALVFTLSEKGGVSDPDARGVSPVFEECLEGVMPRWSFTPVTDQDGDAVELDIGVTLQLSI